MKAKRIPDLTEKEVQRFWGSIKRGNQDECWEWQGPTSTAKSHTYGVFCLYRRIKVGERESAGHLQYKAHRIAFLLSNGQISRELTIDHVCENKLCCNPRHMEEVSQSENTLRGYRRHPERKAGGLCRYGHEREPGRPCGECNRLAQRKWYSRPKNRKKAIARGKRWYEERGGREKKLEVDRKFTSDWRELEKGALLESSFGVVDRDGVAD